MCLIIAVEPGARLSYEDFESALDSAAFCNPDGAGIAYIDGDSVKTITRVENYTAVVNKAIELYLESTTPFFVHFRYNTRGKTSRENTHPFVISETLAMAHNRTLKIIPAHKHWSDTRTVAELLIRLCEADPKFYESPLFYSFIEHQAGSENRFVFLDAKKEKLNIINERKGQWVKGVWFSNLTSWEPYMLDAFSMATLSKKRKASYEIPTEDRIDYGLQDSGDLPLAWGTTGVDSSKLGTKSTGKRASAPAKYRPGKHVNGEHVTC